MCFYICCCGFSKQFFSSLLILFAVLAWHSYGSIFSPLRPFPSAEELKKELGGTFFLRPSDGQGIEYFDINPNGEKLLLFQHGGASTGWNCMKYEALAKEHNLRILCPSFPGSGASFPYEQSIYESNESDSIDVYCSDILALLNQFNQSPISIAGASLGSEKALTCASLFLKEKRKISSISLLVPFAWPNSLHQPVHPGAWIMSIIQSNVMARLFTYYLIPLWMGGMSSETLKQNPDFLNVPLETMEQYAFDIRRSVNYSLLYSLYTTSHWSSNARRSSLPLPSFYKEISQSNTPVYIHYASNDSIAPKYNVDFISKQFNENQVELIEHVNATHGTPDMKLFFQKMK